MFYAYGFDKGAKANRITTWTRIEKQSKKRIDWLHECPYLPQEIAYLWNRYSEMRQGMEKIDYAGIDSYCRRMGEDFEPWEIKIIFEIDTCQMTSQNLG